MNPLHDDRVMDFALARALGGEESVDVTHRVVSRWREGQLEGAVPGTAAPGRRSRQRPRRVLLAASTLLLTGIGGWWMVGELAGGPARVLIEPPALVQRRGGEGWTPARSAVAGVGDVVLLEPGVELRLPASSGSFVATTAALLRIERLEPTVDLQWLNGAGRARTGAVSARIGLGRTQIELAAHSTLELEAQLDPYLLGLDPDPSFSLFVQRLAMQTHALPVSVTLLLLGGSATLTGELDRSLAVGRTVALSADAQRQDPGMDPHAQALLREIGTWDLEVVVHDPGTGSSQVLQGSEVCRVGGGQVCVVSDMTLRVPRPDGERLTKATLMLNYNGDAQHFRGSFVDNFGGDPALVVGEVSTDPGARRLEWLRFDGSPFDIRVEMEWIDADERVTRMLLKQDGEWETLREITHRRKKD